jgi:hypothetical protein
MFMANVLNMASHNDNAFSKKAESTPLTAAEAA